MTETNAEFIEAINNRDVFFDDEMVQLDASRSDLGAASGAGDLDQLKSLERPEIPEWWQQLVASVHLADHLGDAKGAFASAPKELKEYAFGVFDGEIPNYYHSEEDE